MTGHPLAAIASTERVSADGARVAVRPETLLALTSVELAFGGAVALAGVDLSVGAGEIHAVIGPNGAGKSLLLNVISGLYAPDAGSVRIGDTTFGRVPTKRLAKLGVLAPSRTWRCSRV